MKPHIWILAGAGLGLTVYLVINRRSLGRSPASGSLEATATRATRWGRLQRFSGVGRNTSGKVKKSIGKVTGHDALVGEGILDQAAGAVKHSAGEAAEVAAQVIHDVNH